MLIDTAIVQEVHDVLREAAATSLSANVALRCNELRVYLAGLLATGGVILPDEPRTYSKGALGGDVP